MRRTELDRTTSGGGRDQAGPGKSTLPVQQSLAGAREPASPGKQTLTMALPGRGAVTPVQAKAQQASEAGHGDVHAAAQQGIASPGGSLPFLDQIQRSFGRHDVGGVRAHQGEQATAGATAMGAVAFATGNHVAFAGSPSLHTAAHEAAHVVQQREGVHLRSGVGQVGDSYEQHADQVAELVVKGQSAEALLGTPAAGGGGHGGAVQRYEAGEHAKTGDTQDQLKKAYAPIQYTVLNDDTLESIAGKFKISVAELKEANPDKLKKLPVKGAAKKTVEGFSPGDQVAVPQKLNEMARDAVKDPSIKITVNGVVLDYGAVIAMGGDLFRTPEELAAAPPEELKAIAALIAEEKQTGTPVSTARWQAATKGRFLDLAAKNEAHFAPSNAAFVASSGKSTGDHKQSWEDNHHKAVDASRAGDKDKALLTNAFGDHFLTDAFSAGHLFNKRDVMEKFNNQLPTQGKGADREFTKDSTKFFDAIATTVFVGDVATEFSRYETFETHYGFHPNINSASRFSALLQGVHLERPELLESAVAKGVHDKLNTRPGGLAVENPLGDKWPLSGDNTLNAQTLAVAQRAVAQSQQNVIAVFRATAEPDYPALFKRVWDFTPRPTPESLKEIANTAASGSDVNNSGLRTAIVDLVRANYLTIIAELVKLKKLKIA